MRRATRDAMQELREVLGVLGPLGQGHRHRRADRRDGYPRRTSRRWSRSRAAVGIPVEFCWEGPDLDARPARVRRAVHRVVRESLTNVHRYATGAHVTVAVTHTDERVEVRVRNGRAARAARRRRPGSAPGAA